MSYLLKGIVGFVLSNALLMIVMPFFISFLKKRNINQITSEYALDEYKQKEKTPIMGGLLFVVLPIIVYSLCNHLAYSDRKVLFVLLSFALYCTVGFLDDLLVIVRHDNEGLSPKTRLIMEMIYVVLLFVLFRDIIPTRVTIPFTTIGIELPWFVFLPFMALLYMAEANAVNFTDGMDGLCAGVSFISLIPFVVFAVVYKEFNILVLLLCILGGLLAYLYFNHHPAMIFMGDSGSLALGALFSSLAIVFDKTIALFVIGGVFVLEMFCVVVQQLAVRLFHKRVFLYTPIHYAFSIKGYKETKIVLGFYIVALIFSIIGFIIGIKTL